VEGEGGEKYMISEIKSFIKENVGKALVVASFFGAAVAAHAQTPAYTMNTAVQTSVTDLLSSLISTYFGIIPVALALVGGLMVTLFGIGKLIGWVRGNMHG
jgi:hypothetical protein